VARVAFVVTFLAAGHERTVEFDGSLLDAARHAGLPLASSCRGAGLCDACRVSIPEGVANLSAPTTREQERRLGPGERLGCQALVLGPVTVTTSYW